tara:strand:+ start:10312 stop:10569 length:258 start_codon:yes stop_codon:yes gene_type:complete
MAKVPLFISELNASSIYYFLKFTRTKLVEDDENTFGEKLLVDAIDEYIEEFEKHNDIEIISSRVSDEFQAKEAVFDLVNRDHGKN